MEKVKMSLSQLERIDYSSASSPKEEYAEYEIQALSYKDGGSYIHYYKCPCGNGRVVDDKDTTSGHRSHEIIIECKECREKYEIV